MARLETYRDDNILKDEDRLPISSYEGYGQSGPIYLTRNVRLDKLAEFLGAYVTIDGQGYNFESISTAITNNTTAIATANQSLTTLANDQLAQATFQTNLAATFGTFDDDGNLLTLAESFANQILQTTSSDRFATSTFATNLAASFGTYDANGNITQLSESFANQVLTTTSSDKFATSQFVTNLGSSFGTVGLDGSVVISESFANSVLSTANTEDLATTSAITSLASSFGTLNADGTVTLSDSFANEVLSTANTDSFASAARLDSLGSTFGAFDQDGNFSISEAKITNELNTYTGLNFASTSAVETLEATIDGKPSVYRQATQPSIYDNNSNQVIANGSIWYDTDDENKVYIVVNGANPGDDSFWQVTDDSRIGATVEKITNMSASFGSFDENNGFTISGDSDYLDAVVLKVDTDSATASKVTNLNATLDILNADGTVKKNNATFFQDIITDVDANSATASRVSNLNATLDILNADGTVKKNTADFFEDIRTDVDTNSATAQKAESLRVDIEGQDGTGGLTASVNQTQQAVAAKPDIFRQTTAPSTDNPLNSVWYDTDDSNKPYILIGNPKTWTETTDERVGEIINNVSASYGLEVDANGNIASMKLLADGTSGSSIVFNADTFKVYNGTTSETPFEVVGGVVKIKSANIGSVSFGSLSDVPDTFITTVIYATDANGTSPSTTKGTRNFVAFYNGASAWNDGDTLPSGLTFTQMRGDDGAPGADGADGADGATGPQGPPGPAGQDGVDGINGTNGVDGTDGVPGVDGDSANVVVSNATTAQCPNGGKVYEFYVGTTLIDTQIVCNGVDGADGADGADGINGTNGTDGADGAAGIRITTGIIWYSLGSSTAPATPSSSGVTFNFSNGTFSSLPTNWSVEPPQMEAGTASNKYWTSRYQVIESSSGSGSGTPSFFTPIRAFAFDQVVTFSSLGTAGSTTIDGGNITTGFIRSNNWDEPDTGETFADAGTALYLNSGAIISKNFVIDTSGNAFFKGELEAGLVNIADNVITMTADDTTYTNAGRLSFTNSAGDEVARMQAYSGGGVYGSIYLSTYEGTAGQKPGIIMIPNSLWQIGDTGIGLIQGSRYLTDKRIQFTADTLMYSTVKSTNGYVKLFDGTILQWGYKLGSTTTVYTAFPASFPTACTSVTVTLNRTNRSGDGSGYAYNLTKTGFTAVTDSPYDFWFMAIGY